MDIHLQDLNDQFAIPNHVNFQTGPGGLATAVIRNAYAKAEMTLAGGHVLTCTPHGEKPLLWISPNASYSLGKAIRGGIPVCWPWFGPHPTDPQKLPVHGLVRTMLWSVKGTRALPDGSTEVRMAVSDTPETRSVWPHAFELEVTVRVGAHLWVAWSARSSGDQPFTYTGAMHPYYPVSDIRAITIRGLEGVDYLDKPDGYKRKTQEGALKFSTLTDRIYLDTVSEVVIEDPGWERRLRIAKKGSSTTVVWNPDTGDADMADVGAGQHRFFVCVEPANAVDDQVIVGPEGEGLLEMEIWAEPWRGR